MDVSQKYNLREANGDDRIDPLRKRPFSDVNAEVIFKPSDRFSGEFEGRLRHIRQMGRKSGQRHSR